MKNRVEQGCKMYVSLYFLSLFFSFVASRQKNEETTSKLVFTYLTLSVFFNLGDCMAYVFSWPS